MTTAAGNEISVVVGSTRAIAAQTELLDENDTSIDSIIATYPFSIKKSGSNKFVSTFIVSGANCTGGAKTITVSLQFPADSALCRRIGVYLITGDFDISFSGGLNEYLQKRDFEVAFLSQVDGNNGSELETLKDTCEKIGEWLLNKVAKKYDIKLDDDNDERSIRLSQLLFGLRKVSNMRLLFTSPTVFEPPVTGIFDIHTTLEVFNRLFDEEGHVRSRFCPTPSGSIAQKKAKHIALINAIIECFPHDFERQWSGDDGALVAKNDFIAWLNLCRQS